MKISSGYENIKKPGQYDPKNNEHKCEASDIDYRIKEILYSEVLMHKGCRIKIIHSQKDQKERAVEGFDYKKVILSL